MSSPGQKRGNCGHVMALLDNHKKCARCRRRGWETIPVLRTVKCVKFTPAQVQQLATPTYRSRKERGEQKKSEVSSDAPPLSWTFQS